MMRIGFFTCLLGAALAQTLPKPDILEVIEREFEAIVHFSSNYQADAGDTVGQDKFPEGVESYLVEWGPATQDFPLTIRHFRPVAQMQLLDGVTLFKGRVSHLGKNSTGTGMIKGPTSDVFYFRSSSAEVNVLREEMKNIFFDDFNGDAGDFDERRWNLAFSLCALSKTTNFNVNVQKHMHTQVGSLSPNCPGESMTARARGLFSFGDRPEARVVVDVDGPAFPGQQFIMSLSRDAHDLAMAPGVTHTVHIVQDNSQMWVEQIDGSGQKTVLPNSQVNLFPRGDNTYSTANVRRPWVWTVNRNRFSLSINGQTIYSNLAWPQRLAFVTGHVSMTHKHIQSQQSGSEAVTMHSDNFGFDGAEQNQQTFSYRNVRVRPHFLARSAIFPITIPDSIVGAVAARIRFTVTGNAALQRNIHVVSVNGNLEPIPDVPAFVFTDDTLEGANVVIPVVTTRLRTGQNIIAFGDFPGYPAIPNGIIGNFHIELDFECDVNPTRAFTPPTSKCIFASSGFPISFNCDQFLLPRPVLHHAANQVFTRDGNGVVASIEVDIDTGRQLRHAGGSKGIRKIEILVDCVVVDEVDLRGEAFRIRDLTVNVRVPGPGIREVWLRAVDNAGGSSVLLSEGEFADFTVGKSFSPLAFRNEVYRPMIVNTEASGTATVTDRAFGNTCGFDEAFTGGDCADTCIFTEGLVEPSVCPGQADSIGQQVYTPGRFNQSVFPRAPPRAQLTDSWRRDDGEFGDWFEDPNSDERLDFEPPGFNQSELDAACARSTLTSDSCTFDVNDPRDPRGANAAATNQLAPPNTNPPHWLNRAMTRPFVEDSSEPSLSAIEAIVGSMEPPTEPSSASMFLPMSALFATLALCVV